MLACSVVWTVLPVLIFLHGVVFCTGQVNVFGFDPPSVRAQVHDMGFSTSTYYQARPSPLSSRMTVHFAYATSRLTALLHRPLTSACAHTHQAGKTEHTALADEGAPLSHNLSWTLDHPEQTWKEIPGERCVVRVRVRVARRELRAQMYPERAPGGANVSRLASRPLSTIHS